MFVLGSKISHKVVLGKSLRAVALLANIRPSSNGLSGTNTSSAYTIKLLTAVIVAVS
jgi:hypothetical protein